MSTVSYTRISAGGARGAASLNDILSAIQTQSVNVDDENVRPNGLDLGVLEADVAVVKPAGWKATGEGPTSFTNTSYAVPTIGGTQMRTTGGIVSVPASARVEIDAEVAFVTDNIGGPTDWGVDPDLYVDVIIAYSIASSVTQATDTRRWFGQNSATFGFGSGGVVHVNLMLGSANYDWFEIQTRISSAGSYQMGYASISAKYYVRS